MSSSIFSTPYNQYRFIGAPNKVAFLKNLMNVIDVLAIAPYWISLFFLDETPSVEAVTYTSTLLEDEGEIVNEEDSTFGSVSRIMQVLNKTKTSSQTVITTLCRFSELLVLCGYSSLHEGQLVFSPWPTCSGQVGKILVFFFPW